MNNAKKPNPDDALIGHNIRTRRLALGLSQEKLGEAVGVTFQQIQKYEKGSNRVGGSRLIQIAGALQTTAASLMPAETITSETSEAGRVYRIAGDQAA